jgi:hypothetical protein
MASAGVCVVVSKAPLKLVDWGESTLSGESPVFDEQQSQRLRRCATQLIQHVVLAVE